MIWVNPAIVRPIHLGRCLWPPSRAADELPPHCYVAMPILPSNSTAHLCDLHQVVMTRRGSQTCPGRGSSPLEADCNRHLRPMNSPVRWRWGAAADIEVIATTVRPFWAG
jgi:hypothetical protein